MPGRTDNEIKNYWNTHIRKRLIRNGIDPVTHAPRLDFLDLSSILSSALCNPSSSLLNLSSLLGTQALLNPELLRLATALTSPKQENLELILHRLQENQLYSSLSQNQVPLSQPNQFQNPAGQDVPACTTSSAPFVSQTQLMQVNVEGFSPNTNFSCQNSQENLVPSSVNDNLVSEPNFVHCTTNPTIPEFSENSRFQSVNNNGYQNFSIDSVMSTPLTSPDPLNSSSTFINGSTEDERESHCSSLFKFEIPESLDIEDFM